MRQWVRKIALALAVLTALCLMPGVAGAEQTQGGFVLVAEAGGKLVIAPEYVPFQPGQTIRQALQSSGHSFAGLDQGWITAIDGVTGNYTRSDENGGYDLEASAASIGFFRFSEADDSRPGENLRALMTAMADYSTKAGDVRAAAKDSYDRAFQMFVGVSEAQAQTLALQLNQAVKTYEDSLTGQMYSLHLGDGNKFYSRVDFPGVTLRAENVYGRVWTDTDGDGILSLPGGSYTFLVEREGLGAKGSVTVEEDTSVTVELPTGTWLKTDTFRLSGTYGDGDGETPGFDQGEFPLSAWSGRTVTASVRDTASGAVYVFAEYDDTALPHRPTLTACYRMADSEIEMEKNLVFSSLESGAYGVLARGSQGNTVVYRLESQEEDYTRFQDYTVVFDRVPTLTALTLEDQEGTDLAPNLPFSPDTLAYSYKVLDTVTGVTVRAQAREGYEISVNGTPLEENPKVTLSGDTTIRVTVAANGYSTDYTLQVSPGEGKRLSFKSDSTVTVVVTNSNGVIMPYTTHKEAGGQNRYQYTLVPGETYHYIATKDTCFHITDDFRLEEVANSLITLDFGTTEHWLQDLAFGDNEGNPARGNVAMTQAFSPDNHSYTLVLPDTDHILYAWVTGGEDIRVQAIYSQLHSSDLYMGKQMTLDLTSGLARGTALSRLLMFDNPVENTLTLRLTKKRGTDGVTLYQDYQVKVARTLTLQDLEVTVDGEKATLLQPDGTTGFRRTVRDYTLLVSVAARELRALPSCYQENLCFGEDTVGYRVYADGRDITDAGACALTLDGTMADQTLSLRVENDKAPGGTVTYTLRILKSPPVETEFVIAPEKALLDLRQAQTGQRITPEGGKYLLSEGYSYNYSLTCYGYVGRGGTLTVTRDGEDQLVIRDGDITHPVTALATGGTAQITWSLDKAPVNSGINTGLSAVWPDFRGSGTNNAVTAAPVPYAAEEGTLYWATKLGVGVDSDAVGSPILVDGDIITYASDKIYRVDPATGDVKVTGTMHHKSSFSITPPTYGEGMVFMALAGGTVQAFDAVTLEPLWMYQDPLGGQPNSPMTVKDGYLYTGFWNSEVGEANFVCLSITDEDPSRGDETKPATWYYTVKGGFYWAGACVSGGRVLVGTDDGFGGCTSQTAQLLLLDAATGALLDSWQNLNGDIRSTVVYDSATDAFYFTGKGGSFYGVRVSEEGKLTDKWSLTLENGTAATPMSTSSPVVYNGRAYIGVSGAGQFSAYSGNNITVIDLAGKSIAYRVETEGYPQTSGLVTTAYQQEGCVYVFFFDNMTPGKLRVLRDRPGQTRADYVTAEGGNTVAYALFTPVGEQAQYAICSPICDEEGTVYFKNDSGFLMAFGSAVDSLEVTRQPDRTTYAPGDLFDPTGMAVTAHLANGLSRDVTEFVSYSEKPLTAEDTSFAITYPYVMYHNTEAGAEMTAGEETILPVTTLTLTFGEAVLGDVNGDGTIDETDAGIILDYEAGLRKAAPPMGTADVSGDGVIDSNDAVLIAQYAGGSITTFPAEEQK